MITIQYLSPLEYENMKETSMKKVLYLEHRRYYNV